MAGRSDQRRRRRTNDVVLEALFWRYGQAIPEYFQEWSAGRMTSPVWAETINSRCEWGLVIEFELDNCFLNGGLWEGKTGM
jgi:hypothetical protein